MPYLSIIASNEAFIGLRSHYYVKGVIFILGDTTIDVYQLFSQFGPRFPHDKQYCNMFSTPILQEVRDESGEVYTNGYCKPLKRPGEFRYSPEETSTQHTEHAHAEP